MAVGTAGALGVLRPSSRTRPELRVVEWQGERAVAKDWSHVHPVMRPHARRCIEREWRALHALAGLPAVPRPLARLPHGIVVSHVEGEPLHWQGFPMEARPRFFAALEACVGQMHARGVAHLDLRQRRNLLRAPDGTPRLVDFEAAFVCDPGRAPGRWLLAWGRRVDRLALLKHRASFLRRHLTPRELRLARWTSAGRWLWPSTPLHRLRVSLRRLLRGDRS
jgi:predicted Ser/Thr protein kinase